MIKFRPTVPVYVIWGKQKTMRTHEIGKQIFVKGLQKKIYVNSVAGKHVDGYKGTSCR